jgi:cytoskeletal protein CcmA (bactofilin family)
MGVFGRKQGENRGTTPSLLAAGSQFAGDIHTDGPLLVNGQVHGDGQIDGELTLAPGALWHGKVQAHTANVGGTIEGDVVITSALKLNATAVIRGNVRAQTATIATGAIIDGELQVTGAGSTAARQALKRRA